MTALSCRIVCNMRASPKKNQALREIIIQRHELDLRKMSQYGKSNKLKLYLSKIQACPMLLNRKTFHLNSTLMLKSMKEPIEPRPEDCCNSGCNPCIFDIYERQLKLYKKYIENGTHTETVENYISQLECKDFIVVKNSEASASHKFLAFKKGKNDESKKVWWKPGDHFLLKYVSPDINCSRAYTPLKLKRQQKEDFDFGIMVKICEHGLVSKFLNDLQIGDKTSWRGPFGSYTMKPNVTRIIMIAQGTGIVPFISIIEKIIHNEEDMTKIYLLFCCHNENTIIFREDLYNFKDFWNFKYKIFLDQNTSLNIRYQESIHCRKLNFDDINGLGPFSTADCFLLCGSSKFMKVYEEYLKKSSVLEDNIFMF